MLKSRLFYSLVAPKGKSSDTGDLDMPKGSHKELPLSKKVKGLDLISRKKKSYLEVDKIYTKNDSSICEIVKEKEICASFDAKPQTAKITAIVHNKLKWKSHLCAEDRKHTD